MFKNDTTEHADSEAIPLQRVAQTTRPRRSEGNHVVHILSEETNPGLHELGLASVFKPILYSSMAFGLIWKRSSTKWFDIHTVHSCALILLLWYQAVRYFAGYSKEDRYGSALFHKIVVHTWVTQLAVGVPTYIYSKYRNIPTFIREWENYKIKYGGITLSFMKRHVRRRIVIIILAIIFMLVSCVIWVVFRPSLFTKWLFPLLKYTDENVHNVNVGLFVLYVLIASYTVLTWFQCAFNTLCYCLLLKLEFTQFATQFSEYVHYKTAQPKGYANLQSSDSQICNDNHPTTSNASSGHKNECEHYRTRYVCLCKLVQKLDGILNIYLLIMYSLSIPMVILLLYSATDNSSFSGDIISAIMGINSLLLNVMLIICVTTSASSLATAVRFCKNSSFYQVMNLFPHYPPFCATHS